MEAVAGTSFKTVISQKKFKELPIYIAENHNEVFSHLYFHQILALYKLCVRSIYVTMFMFLGYCTRWPRGWSDVYIECNSFKTPSFLFM